MACSTRTDSGLSTIDPPSLVDLTPNRKGRREAANEIMIMQAKRMKLNAGGRPDLTQPLTVGTVVTVALEKVDRGKTNLRRLPGVVLAITERSQYRIGVKGGTLKNCFRRGDLVVEREKNAGCYEGLAELLSRNYEELTKLSLREANSKVSATGGQGMMHCKCGGDCSTARCACHKAGHFCNSRCHPSSNKCSNCYADEEEVLLV